MKEHSVEELKKELERLQQENAELRLAGQQRRNLWTNLSLELRTPLNVIIGMANLWKEECDDAQKVMENYTKVENCSRTLLGIVNNMVDYLAIEEDGLKIQPVDFSLRDLVTSLTIQYHKKAREKGIHFHVQIRSVDDEMLKGDEQRLQQILDCFMRYSLDSTPAGGVMDFSLLQASASKGRAFMRFQFKTTGTENYDRLAGYFCADSGHEHNRHDTGNSLELYVCRYLIQAMDGKVSLKQSGNDSTLILDISFDRIRQMENYEVKGFFHNDKVLLIGADEKWCRARGEKLAELEVPFDCAADLETALDMIGEAEDSQHPYVICVFDWYSEVIPAEELVEEIRSIFGEDMILIAVVYDAINKAAVIRSSGVDYAIEDAWFRSTVFDALIKVKEGEVQAGEEVKKQERIYNFAGRRVLIAEDVALNMEVVLQLMSRVGIESVCAENGMEAVSFFERKPAGYFDCILMDINMPIMDGYTAARTIRRSEKADASSIPIYAMTANAFSDDIQDALNAGMDGHIAKPIETDVLYHALEKAFAQKEKEVSEDGSEQEQEENCEK